MKWLRISQTFLSLHQKLVVYKDCHLAGFNSNKFDVPMLIEEFLRADFDFDISTIELIDVQNIFHKMERELYQLPISSTVEKNMKMPTLL